MLVPLLTSLSLSPSLVVLGSMALAESAFEYPALTFDGYEMLPSSPAFVKSNEKSRELLQSCLGASQQLSDLSTYGSVRLILLESFSDLYSLLFPYTASSHAVGYATSLV